MARNLTPKQEKFAQLVASGVNHSDAYRQAYSPPNSAPSAIQANAYKLAVKHTQVAQRIVDLAAPAVAETQIRAKDLIESLKSIADGEIQEPLKASEKIAAIREIGRLAGLYREPEKDSRPITITHVTVHLDHGDRQTQEEHRVTEPRETVVEGESTVVEEE